MGGSSRSTESQEIRIVNTLQRSQDRCQRILDLIDACLADYAASLGATPVPTQGQVRRRR